MSASGHVPPDGPGTRPPARASLTPSGPPNATTRSSSWMNPDRAPICPGASKVTSFIVRPAYPRRAAAHPAPRQRARSVKLVLAAGDDHGRPAHHHPLDLVGRPVCGGVQRRRTPDLDTLADLHALAELHHAVAREVD